MLELAWEHRTYSARSKHSESVFTWNLTAAAGFQHCDDLLYRPEAQSMGSGSHMFSGQKEMQKEMRLAL